MTFTEAARALVRLDKENRDARPSGGSLHGATDRLWEVASLVVVLDAAEACYSTRTLLAMPLTMT